ncbi:MAG: hypothetical protein Q9222_001780 [Ikaeria aurantiellina]
MCIIKIRRDPPEESPIVVPIRPISRSQPTTAQAPAANSRRSSQMGQIHQQQPRASAGSFERRHGSSQQQVVVAQPSSPRNSRPTMLVQHAPSYSYGSGPVPIEPQDRPLSHSRRSYAHQGAAPARRSGSVNYGTSPRQSNVSFRSTREREKIVVVDETGRRRESGFH